MPQRTRVQDVDLRLQLFAVRKSPSSALEKRVECLEAFEASPQDFFVRQSFPCPTFQDTINPDRFDPLESGVVQIRVVDHLPNFRHDCVGDRKTPDECLESAVVAMVRELSIKHVERDRARHSVCTWREYKLRPWIDELPDHPRRTNPINLRSCPSQPG